MALEIQSSVSGAMGALEAQKAAAEEMFKIADPAKLDGPDAQADKNRELAQAVTGLGTKLDVSV